MATKNGATNGNGSGNSGVPAVSFAKLSAGMNMPNLLDVQLRAFRRLLQTDDETEAREDIGLERVFNEVFPITDVNDKFSLEFVSYTLGEPKYSVEECIERDMTFAAPLKATLRPYQEQGLSWLKFVHDLGTGGILADDMGLGKTIETISLLLLVKQEQKSLRALIVAPTSVVSNWVREIDRFGPTLTTAL